jgi:signal transduction histidine kinase
MVANTDIPTNGLKRLVTVSQINEYWALGSMLLLLHLSLWGNFGSPLSASLMLAHLGLFFIWQPIWQRDQQLEISGALLFCLFTVGFVVWLSWWLTFLWLTLLIGLVAGRNLGEENERNAYLGTMAFLVSELLIKCLPELFDVAPLPGSIVGLFKYGLIIIPLATLFVPFDANRISGVVTVDFLRGMAVSLMTAMLAFGSLLSMYHIDIEYPAALVQSLLMLALFLLLISWLLSPRAGFSGFTALWERSLLNIGAPFEAWLSELANLAEQRQTPETFLRAAMDELALVPWITGVIWQAGPHQGDVGSNSKHSTEIPTTDVTATIFTQRPVGPTLLLHCSLLIELLNHFYVAKQREQELSQRAHLQAIYETGARVTHDIKNLLQSLYTVTSTLDLEANGDGAEPTTSGEKGRRLLQRQLPHITQRLQLALDKLQAPEKAIADETPVQEWWDKLSGRADSGTAVSYTAEIQHNALVPSELFDSVVENLLENARHKQQSGAELQIQVALTCTTSSIRLTVSDDGEKIAEEQAVQLFAGPVASDSGLGIGLYQAAKQAEMLGYQLALTANKPGDVTFELKTTR